MEIQITTDEQGRPTYWFAGVAVNCPPKAIKEFFLKNLREGDNDKVTVPNCILKVPTGD